MKQEKYLKEFYYDDNNEVYIIRIPNNFLFLKTYYSRPHNYNLYLVHEDHVDRTYQGLPTKMMDEIRNWFREYIKNKKGNK